MKKKIIATTLTILVLAISGCFFQDNEENKEPDNVINNEKVYESFQEIFKRTIESDTYKTSSGIQAGVYLKSSGDYLFYFFDNFFEMSWTQRNSFQNKWESADIDNSFVVMVDGSVATVGKVRENSGDVYKALEFSDLNVDKTEFSDNIQTTTTITANLRGLQMYADGTGVKAEFSVPAEDYTSSQSVELTPSEVGGEIYYTLDGTTPTTASAIYNNAIDITEDILIKTLTVKDGWYSSYSEAEYGISELQNPVVNATSGTYTTEQSISISCGTDGAIIRYTTDGTVPTTTAGIIYEEPFTVPFDTTSTIQAISYKEGYGSSPVTDPIEITVTGKVEKVEFSHPGGYYPGVEKIDLALSTKSSGATIYYTTDGTEPTTDSTEYTVPIEINKSDRVTIKAKAFKTEDWESSDLVEAEYTMWGKVATPTSNITAGNYNTEKSVELSVETDGAKIYYTTNGTKPTNRTSDSTYEYTDAITVNSRTRIRAVAVKKEWDDSDEFDVLYTFDQENPVAGTGIEMQNRTDTSATIEWGLATDGTTPNSELEYRVVYSESNNISTLSDAENNGTIAKDWTENLAKFEITGLNSGTTYYFNVIVRDEVRNKAIYSFYDGLGTVDSPYQIKNWVQLARVSDYPDKYFILINDLDEDTRGYSSLASSTAHSGSGWEPIGDSTTGFIGNLNGDGFKISKLYIDRDADNQGLFAKLGQGALVKDLTIDNANLKTASKSGVLAGETVEAEIVNCIVKNAVIDIYKDGESLLAGLKGQERIGGLIGETKNSTIDSSSVSNLMMMDNSKFEDTTYSARLGGLVGLVNGGTVLNSSSSNVTIVGKDKSATYHHNIGYVGGLIGEVANESTESAVVDNCEALDISLSVGSVSGYSKVSDALSKSGGLIGAVGEVDNIFEVNGDIVIKNSSATGTIDKGSAGKWGWLIVVGGFVGTVDGTATPAGEISIQDCEADVNLEIARGEYKYLDPVFDTAVEYGGLGGFAGFLKAVKAEDCSAKGSIVVETLDEAPAMVGGFAANIQDSTITKSYAIGDINGRWASGFVMLAKNSDLSQCYAAGDIEGIRRFTGGFVGRLISGTISNSYATGDVTGYHMYTGGFVSQQDAGAIRNCYSSGDVVVESPKYLITAGLAGESLGTLQDSIAFNSNVTQKSPRSDVVNRISGLNDGTLSNNYGYQDMVVTYAGTEKTGTSDLNSRWGADMTPLQFNNESFYTDIDNWNTAWDFTNIWEMKSGAERPTLIGVGDDDGLTGYAPYVADRTITIDSVGSNNVTLNWNEANDSLTVQSNLQYKVVYSTSDNVGTVTDAENNDIGNLSWETDLASKEITGLNSGTTYYFNVIVKDEAGNKAVYTSGNKETLPAPEMTGSGTSSDPFIIMSIEDLTTIGKGTSLGDGIDYSLSSYYKLGTDLDFTSDSSYEEPAGADTDDIDEDSDISETLKNALISTDDGKGWKPIGATGFIGNFNGDGFKISKLYIDRDADNQGLFAKLGTGAAVKDLTIDDANLKTASKSGVLAGEAVEAEIVNCIVKNAVIDIYINGESLIAGRKGQERIGGLIGETKNSRLDSCSVSNMTMMDNSIFSMAADGYIYSVRLGGLAGLVNGGTILNSSSSNIKIVGKDETTRYNHNLGYVGGLIGELVNESTESLVVDNCSATDLYLKVGVFTTSSENHKIVSKSGGLIGAIGSETDFNTNGDFVIKNSSATGTIEKGATSSWNWLIGVGGFTGTVNGTTTPSGEVVLRNCEADVNLAIPGEEVSYLDNVLDIVTNSRGGVGGFSGLLIAARVEECSAKGTIIEQNSGMPPFPSVNVGGFAGSIEDSTVTKSYATGDVKGIWTGGFVSLVKNSDISKCYAAVDVENWKNFAGGFVARLDSGTISDSYVIGDVTGDHTYVAYTGGFVSQQFAGEIKNCYSLGNVLTEGPKYPAAAGLAGKSDGTVQDSIAFNSNVTQSSSSSDEVNRISGENTGTLSNNYAYSDMVVTYAGTEKTGISDLDSLWGADMTPLQFNNESFFTNTGNWNTAWDFTNIWEMKSGAERPTLIGVGDDDGLTGYAPYVADRTITIDSVGSNNVTLNWNKANDSLTVQSSLQYKVVYSTSDNVGTVTDAENNDIGGLSWETDLASKEITGLNSGTTYYFNVIVKDEAGNKAVYTSASQEIPTT